MRHRRALRRQQPRHYPIFVRLSVSSHFLISAPPRFRSYLGGNLSDTGGTLLGHSGQATEWQVLAGSRPAACRKRSWEADVKRAQAAGAGRHSPWTFTSDLDIARLRLTQPVTPPAAIPLQRPTNEPISRASATGNWYIIACPALSIVSSWDSGSRRRSACAFRMEMISSSAPDRMRVATRTFESDATAASSPAQAFRSADCPAVTALEMAGVR